MSKTARNLENLAESLLTNALFADCDKDWASVTDENLSPNPPPLRDTFRLACQFAAGDSKAAHATAATLTTATLKPTHWLFDGTLHFLSANAAFAHRRDAWMELFTALDTGETPAFRRALSQVQESF